MTAQLELGASSDIPCEWCAAGPAVARVIATFCCAVCAAATAKDRVIAALQRWSRR